MGALERLGEQNLHPHAHAAYVWEPYPPTRMEAKGMLVRSTCNMGTIAIPTEILEDCQFMVTGALPMKVSRIQYWRLLFSMNTASPAGNGGYVKWMMLFRSRKSWKIGKVDVFRLAAHPTPFTPSPYRMHIDAAPYASPYAALIHQRCQWKRLTDHQMGKMS